MGSFISDPLDYTSLLYLWSMISNRTKVVYFIVLIVYFISTDTYSTHAPAKIHKKVGFTFSELEKSSAKRRDGATQLPPRSSSAMDDTFQTPTGENFFDGAL